MGAPGLDFETWETWTSKFHTHRVSKAGERLIRNKTPCPIHSASFCGMGRKPGTSDSPKALHPPPGPQGIAEHSRPSAHNGYTVPELEARLMRAKSEQKENKYPPPGGRFPFCSLVKK